MSEISVKDCTPFRELKPIEDKALKRLCEYFEDTDGVNGDVDDRIASVRTVKYPYDGQLPRVETRWWAGRYIGMVNVKASASTQFEISIRPRFGEQFLLTILEDLYHIKFGRQDADAAKTNDREWFSSLLKILIRRIWVEKCSHANRYGLPRANVKQEHQGVSIKGFLDVRRTIKPWLMKNEVCTNTYEKVLDDRICQIVYEAHRILSHELNGKKRTQKKARTQMSVNGGFVVPPTVQDTINSLNSRFRGVPFRLKESDYRRIRYKSIYLNWKPLVDFSWSIIRDRQMTYRSADTITQCVFVDIAEIWEAYLRKKLGEGLADDGWRVLSSEECHYHIYKDKFYEREIVPDIILQRGNEYMVFDAKYKQMRGIKAKGKYSDIDRNDIFQIHTYMQFVQHKLGHVVLGGLLYPITCKGKDDDGNDYEYYGDDFDVTQYHSKYLFGYEGVHADNAQYEADYRIPFIVDGIYCYEDGDGNKNTAEYIEDKVRKMIERIKKCIKTEDK